MWVGIASRQGWHVASSVSQPTGDNGSTTERSNVTEQAAFSVNKPQLQVSHFGPATRGFAYLMTLRGWP